MISFTMVGMLSSLSMVAVLETAGVRLLLSGVGVGVGVGHPYPYVRLILTKEGGEEKNIARIVVGGLLPLSSLSFPVVLIQDNF